MMDDLVRRHISLLQRYSVLQEELNGVSSKAFLQLSRCRYHGIKVSEDQFRLEFPASLTTRVDVHDPVSPENLDHTPTAKGTGVVKGKSETVEMEELEASLQKSSISGNLDTAVETTGGESSHLHATKQLEDSNHTQLALMKSFDKKRDPIRDIELMPSTTLKHTQEAFNQVVVLALQLATLLVELQNSSDAIDGLRGVGTGAITTPITSAESVASQRLDV